MHVESPNQRRDREEQRQIGDVVHQAVRQHLLGGPAVTNDDRHEQQITQPRTIGHHERAESRPIQAVFQKRFEAPDHQTGGREKKRNIRPDTFRTDGLDDFR